MFLSAPMGYRAFKISPRGAYITYANPSNFLSRENINMNTKMSTFISKDLVTGKLICKTREQTMQTHQMIINAREYGIINKVVSTAIKQYETNCPNLSCSVNLANQETLETRIIKHKKQGSKPLRLILELMSRNRDERQAITNFMTNLGVAHTNDNVANIVHLWKKPIHQTG